MNITNIARLKDGKWVYDNQPTTAEREADRKRFADLIAARQAPGTLGTDRAFMEGHHECGFTDEPDFMRQMIYEKARKAGVITTGKKYVGGLADNRGPADPMAWVSDTGDVKRVCEARNFDCRGAVQNKSREVPPPADIPLSETHIKNIDMDYASVDSKWLKKSPKERREAIIEAHGSPARRKGKKVAT